MFRSIFAGLVLAVAAVALAAGPEIATTAASKTMLKPVTSFGYLDTDKNGRLTREEAKADWAVIQGFVQVDANGDGYLDREEFEGLNRDSQQPRQVASH